MRHLRQLFAAYVAPTDEQLYFMCCVNCAQGDIRQRGLRKKCINISCYHERAAYGGRLWKKPHATQRGFTGAYKTSARNKATTPGVLGIKSIHEVNKRLGCFSESSAHRLPVLLNFTPAFMRFPLNSDINMVRGVDDHSRQG